MLVAVAGSLTVTIWGADDDTEQNCALVHGGPWPASTAPMTTSVGDAALNRFLRPVCLQDALAWLVARGGVPC